MDEFELKFYTKLLGSTALIYPLLGRMRIRQIIEDIVGPTEADISTGKVIEILLNNRLSDPEPLYDVQTWARGNAIEEVYRVNAEQLNDDRLARELDRIHPYIDEIKSAIALHIDREFKVDYRKFHYDLSSFYFEGEYANQREGYVKLCYGHSTDHRPDKIQAKLELKVAHDGYVAFDYRVLDGNSSDMKAAAVVESMERLKQLAKLDDLVRISDRGTHSRANALRVIESGGQYVATVRLSPHYRRLFLEADSRGEVVWEPVEYVAYHQRRKAQEQQTKYWVWEVEDKLSYGEKEYKEYVVRNLYFKSSSRQRQDIDREKAEGIK
jgi:transposase